MVTSSIFNPSAVAPYMGTTYAAPAVLRPEQETLERYVFDKTTVLDRFFGEERKSVARSFVESASIGRPRAEVVYATRRNGKTALISYLEALAAKDLPNALVLRLDGQDVVNARDSADFYRDLIKYDADPRITATLSEPGQDIRTAFWRGINKISKTSPVILCVDEPMHILNGDVNFFKEWRALYDRGANVSMLFTTFTEALLAMMREDLGIYSSSMNVAITRGLPAFTADDCGAMLMDRLFNDDPGFQLSAGFKEYVRVVSGGNPYPMDIAKRFVHQVFSGELGVDWRALIDPDIKAHDYLLLSKKLSNDMLISSNAVREAFMDGVILNDGSVVSHGKEGFSIEKYFKLLSRRLLFSGRFTFDMDTVFRPHEAEEIGIERGGRFYEFWKDYLLTTGVLAEVEGDSDFPESRFDSLPLLNFSKTYNITSAADAASLGLAHLFERYPNHAGDFFAAFKDGKLVVDLDDQPFDGLSVSPVEEGSRLKPQFWIKVSPIDVAKFFFYHTV